MQEAADDLVSLYKRVSLDDDLDDALRSELLSQLSAGRLSFKFPLNPIVLNHANKPFFKPIEKLEDHTKTQVPAAQRRH